MVEDSGFDVSEELPQCQFFGLQCLTPEPFNGFLQIAVNMSTCAICTVKRSPRHARCVLPCLKQILVTNISNNNKFCSSPFSTLPVSIYSVVFHV